MEPGVLYRSAQLSGAALNDLIRDKGIRTVLNLRGAHAGQQWYDRELAATINSNAEHLDLKLSASTEPTRTTLNELLQTLRRARKPLLIHCEGGADRSGLAAALYELRIAGKPTDKAAGQLSFFYGHFPWLLSRSGAMDRAFWRVVAEKPEGKATEAE